MTLEIPSKGLASVNISERLLPEFDHEMSNTRTVLGCVPDDQLGFKPHEKSMTLGRLAGHVAEMPSWAAHTLQHEVLDITPNADGTNNAHTMTSKADTLHKFDQWCSEARSALLATPDQAYAQIWKLTGNGQTYLEMPRSVVLRNVVLNHMIHHRGQLSVYLRLLGRPVPGIYGPSADDQAAASV